MNYRHDRPYKTSNYDQNRDRGYADNPGHRGEAQQSRPLSYYTAQADVGYQDEYGGYEPGWARTGGGPRYGQYPGSSDGTPWNEAYRYGQDAGYGERYRSTHDHDRRNAGLFNDERYYASRYGRYGGNNESNGRDAGDAYRRRGSHDSFGSNHAGKGPRGYTRSDERICDELYDQLTNSPDIDASGIEIVVENGTVSLSGQVPDRQMKHEAEDCADRINGVKDVDNRIKVQRDNNGTDRSGTASSTP